MSRNRTLRFNNLAFACNVFFTTALLTWPPTYFHRTDGIAMDKAGTKAATVMLLALIGALSDAFGLGTALAALPLFTFTASLLFLAGSFHYVKDASRVERIEVRMEST